MDLAPYLPSNLTALTTHSPRTAAWLGAHPESIAQFESRYFQQRPGLMDWRQDNGHGLFSAMPPNMFYMEWTPLADRESQELLARSATILVGCCLGYGLNHLLEHTPANHKVIVVEPRAEMLLAAFAATEYVPFMEAGKLTFLPPIKEDLESHLQKLDMQFLFGKIDVKGDVPSRQLGPEYAQLQTMVREIMENIAVELTTMRRCQDIMVGNELANFQHALEHGSIARLQGAAKGVRAVILGAGPSLKLYADELARRSGALYTTALQTLPALQSVGITPHCCMAIDYSDGMRCVYDRLDLEWAKSIPLLYSTKLDPEVLSRYPGPKLPVWTRGGLGTFALSQQEYILHAGGNVSLALFRLLSWFGVSSVTLAGQDFAWKEDAPSHMAGHHGDYRSNHNLVSLKNAAGETIWSSLSYLTAMREMAADIQAGDVPVNHLYGGGAIIDGAAHVDMEAVDEQGLLTSAPGALPAFLQALQHAQVPRQRPEYEARSDRWAVSLRNATKRLEKLFKRCGKEQQAIAETVQQLHYFLRQDPLYLPYLYNEIMDIGGLRNPGRPYQPKDLSTLRNILKRANGKVREMDRVVCGVRTKNGAPKSASNSATKRAA